VGLLGFIGRGTGRGVRRRRGATGSASGLEYFDQSSWLMVLPLPAGPIFAHRIMPLGDGVPRVANIMRSRSEQAGREQDYQI
jgi:hypothetical protein